MVSVRALNTQALTHILNFMLMDPDLVRYSSTCST